MCRCHIRRVARELEGVDRSDSQVGCSGMASSACRRIRRRYVAGSNGLGNPPKHSNANVRRKVVKDNDGAVWRTRGVVNGKTSPRNPVNSLGSSASGQEFAQAVSQTASSGRCTARCAARCETTCWCRSVALLPSIAGLPATICSSRSKPARKREDEDRHWNIIQCTAKFYAPLWFRCSMTRGGIWFSAA